MSDQHPLDRDALQARRAAARRRTRRQRVGALVVVGVVVTAVAGGVLVSSGGTSHAHATVATTSTTIQARRQPAHATTTRTTPAAHEHALELAAVRKTVAASGYVIRGTPRHKLVALTFDDGPGPTTPKILAWLERHHVPATFFVIGSEVNADPALVRDEARAGDVIGDHTETHLPLGRLDTASQQAEIVDGVAAIKDATGRHVDLFRPPEGSFNQTTLGLLKQAGLLMVLWTVDTKDYTQPGTSRIIYTALSGARAGTIILMHDGGGDRTETLTALPTIVHQLRIKGYRLVTIPRLLVGDPVPSDQPPPHPLSGG